MHGLVVQKHTQPILTEQSWPEVAKYGLLSMIKGHLAMAALAWSDLSSLIASVVIEFSSQSLFGILKSV